MPTNETDALLLLVWCGGILLMLVYPFLLIGKSIIEKLTTKEKEKKGLIQLLLSGVTLTKVTFFFSTALSIGISIFGSYLIYSGIYSGNYYFFYLGELWLFSERDGALFFVLGVLLLSLVKIVKLNRSLKLLNLNAEIE